MTTIINKLYEDKNIIISTPLAWSGAVDSVNGKTWIVTLNKTDVGLSDVDNTSDLDKPISDEQATVNATKQDVLTEGAFVDGDKTKLDNIEDNAKDDQTDSEIKTAYEKNSDTNAFTDDEKTKLANALITETVTTLGINANVLKYTDEEGVETDLDLSLYLDDTNLARITDGTLDSATGIATFERDDSTTFTLDLSSLLDTDTKTITDLTDTNITNLLDGQTLKYDNNEWINHTLIEDDISDLDKYTKLEIDTALDLKEDKSNKITAFQSTTDDTHYPSEKLVKDNLDTKEPVFTKNTAFNKDFGTTSGTVVEGDDARLSDERDPKTHTHTASEITDFDTEVSNNPDVTNNTAKRTYPQADEDKLATIEDDAKDDQTGAEIKSLYEAEEDTNAFTDDEKTNLSNQSWTNTGDQDLSGFYTKTESDENFEPKDSTILKDADIDVTVQSYDVDTTKNDVSNTFTLPQKTSITSSTNDIDFALNNNFVITATANNITATNITAGQGGVIIINDAENITGWGTEFKFKTLPTLSGKETFAYFIEDATNIMIGVVK